MPGESDCNRATDLERLLGQTMRAQMAPPTPECLDAERLAAWSDGALSAIEGFDVEQHLSTCERCQAMLAAYVRITGAESEAAVVLPFWRKPVVRWTAPIAAAAAAGVLWFVMPRSASTPVPTTQITRAEEPVDRGPAGLAPEMPTTPAPSAASRGTLGQSMGAANARDMQYRGPSDDRAKSAEGKPVGGAGSAGAIARGRDSEPSPSTTGQREEAATTAPAYSPTTAPPPTVPATPAVPPKPSEQVAITAEVTPVQTGQSQMLAAPSAAPMARRQVGVVEIVPRSMAAAAPARADADAAAASKLAVRTRWQIRPDGTVVRILGDAGTPEPVTLSRPAPVTGGDAASPSECWLIGFAGAVWRSTDGLRFDRVVFVDAADLTAVRATSASAATVTTADGRQFATINGGANWQILQTR